MFPFFLHLEYIVTFSLLQTPGKNVGLSGNFSKLIAYNLDSYFLVFEVILFQWVCFEDGNFTLLAFEDVNGFSWCRL